jgi:hypothetical protein
MVLLNWDCCQRGGNDEGQGGGGANHSRESVAGACAGHLVTPRVRRGGEGIQRVAHALLKRSRPLPPAAGPVLVTDCSNTNMHKHPVGCAEAAGGRGRGGGPGRLAVKAPPSPLALRQPPQPPQQKMLKKNNNNKKLCHINLSLSGQS